MYCLALGAGNGNNKKRWNLYKKISLLSRFFACVFFLQLSIPSSGQLRWVQENYQGLPKSIRVFKTTDSLDGRPLIAYYAIAELKSKKLDFTTEVGYGVRYKPSEYYKRDSAYLVVNGTFFSFQTNQNLNMVVRDGILLAYNVPSLKSKTSDSFYYPTRSAIGISSKGKPDVAWIFTDTAEALPYAFQARPIVAKGRKSDPSIYDLKTLDIWKWWKMKTAIGGGPVLLQEGRINITNQEEQMFVDGLNDRHPRTAMGYTKNRKLIILVIEGRNPGKAEGATLAEEAKILQDLGCVEALNLDGGGSSCMLINGRETIRPSDKEGQRPVPAVFIIKAKKRKR